MDLADLTGIGKAVSNIFDSIVDKIVPDAAQREDLKMKKQQLDLDVLLAPLKLQLSAILTEAQSTDKWTSRARPSFLYVIYLMILCGLPVGILSAFKPDIATAIGTGLGAWLNAIPDPLYALFGVGYLGYTGMRTWDKRIQNK